MSGYPAVSGSQHHWRWLAWERRTKVQGPTRAHAFTLLVDQMEDSAIGPDQRSTLPLYSTLAECHSHCCAGCMPRQPAKRRVERRGYHPWSLVYKTRSEEHTSELQSPFLIS